MSQIPKSSVSASSGACHSQSDKLDQDSATARSVNPTSKRVKWTLFGLQAYVKESQTMASRDKYQVVPEFQGMNIYSDKCPTDPRIDEYKEHTSKMWRGPVCQEAYHTVTHRDPDEGDKKDLMSALQEADFDLARSIALSQRGTSVPGTTCQSSATKAEQAPAKAPESVA